MEEGSKLQAVTVKLLSQVEAVLDPILYGKLKEYVTKEC